MCSSDLVPSHPGQLVEHTGPRAWARVAPESWSTPRAIRQEHDSPGRAAQNREPSDPGLSGPGQHVDTLGPRTQARVTQDSWSMPRALGPWSESPGGAVRNRRPSEPSTSHQGQLFNTRALRHGPESPGQLVNHEGLWTWLTAWDLRPGPETPGSSGRNREASGTVPSRPGLLMDPVSPRTGARVALEPW